MGLDGAAVIGAEMRSVLAILGAGRGCTVIGALVDDAQRHADWLVEGAKEIIPPGPIACRERCAFCCHLHVLATIPEVLQIAEDLRSTLDAEELAALRGRIAAHRAAMSGAGVAERRGIRAACPLLVEDRCSVYPIRPMSCRGWNSLDVGGCEADHLDPSRGICVPIYMPQHQVNACVQEGMVAGLRRAGLEHERVELVAALEIALETPDAAARWLAGEPVFRDAGV